jgi:hypothetical protein
MNSTELDGFIARVQAGLAFFLIIVLLLLVGAVVVIFLLPHVQVNQVISNLLVQVVTGVLALAGTAVGFFFARTRPGVTPDSTTTVTQTHTAPDGAKTVITSPAATTSVPVVPVTTPEKPQ